MRRKTQELLTSLALLAAGLVLAFGAGATPASAALGDNLLAQAGRYVMEVKATDRYDTSILATRRFRVA